jgi:hypothetical protein
MVAPKNRQVLAAFALPRLWWPWVALGFLLVPLLLAQTRLPLVGTVTTKDGQPLAGVGVYGSMSKVCCPFKREQSTTDNSGQFRLENPGSVIHFFKKEFQPRAVVVEPEAANLRITLQLSTDTFPLPVCGKLERGQERIGWGKYGLRFNVVKRAVKILEGNPDADYTRYVIKPKTGKAYLELWFGPYAMDEVPDDDQFISSDKFAQRNAVASDGQLVGMDSWGQQRDGGIWRWTAVLGEGGSRYRNTPPEQANLFDQIVNSACEVPYPSQR